MYNCSLDEPLHYLHQQIFLNSHQTPLHNSMNSTNKFVYVKKTFPSHSVKPEPIKVLVNPNFNKKVFVNPNFNGNRQFLQTQAALPPQIHFNPNAPNLNRTTDINEFKNSKIHVNPNMLKKVQMAVNDTVVQENCDKKLKNHEKDMNHTIISTRTKLVRSKTKSVPESKIIKRRSSIRSQFKVIKSSLLLKSDVSETEVKSKYKLTKPNHKYSPKNLKPLINKFKVDNRAIKVASPKYKRYVYINRFLSISDIVRNNLLKKNKHRLSVVNIDGVFYKKSPNCLKKTSTSCQKSNKRKTEENLTCKSKYKFMRKSLNTSKSSNKTLKLSTTKFKINDRKNISKLRLCNIPCPYYRKFGRCKGKENGKCRRKHDPDQIALCTKFLQGACIDKKCLLSHNVSPEKMPTCKFYLEGSCSRDDCPYLHVRISPKADVCKDFLEGFCKKAAECDKRHQFLCPDYEKNGNCLKQRCPYPHGKMVRKYSVFNKDKFAKKSSNNGTTKVKIDSVAKRCKIKPETVDIAENCEGNVKSRYYIGQNNLDVEEIDGTPHSNTGIDQENDRECGIKCRPQLGKLPSFIAFESS